MPHRHSVTGPGLMAEMCRPERGVQVSPGFRAGPSGWPKTLLARQTRGGRESYISYPAHTPLQSAIY